MRWCLGILMGWGPVLTYSQGEWSFLFDVVSSKLAIYDAIERPTGGYFLVGVTHTSYITSGAPVTRTWVIGVSEGGGQEDLIELTNGLGRSVWVPQIIQHTEDEWTALAMSWIHSTLSDFGITRYILGSTGEVLNSLTYTLDDDNEKISYRNVTLLEGDEVYVAGGLITDGSLIPNKLLFLRMDLEGTGLHYHTLGSGQGIRLAHHALPLGDDMLVSIEGGSGGVGPSGYAKFFRFNDEFDFVGGFAMTSLSGSGNVGPPDSVLVDCMYMSLLAGDTMITSGRFGYVSNGMRAAMIRFTPDGDYAGTFLPRGDFFQEGPAGIQGHDLTPDGKMLFAMVENFFPGPPNYEMGTAPSRVRVYRLDTLLNVECEFLLDGFEDNAYYYLMRIKAASDGGALLMGSRRDLNTMEQPRGWIMKLGPDQCYTGLEEQTTYGAPQVFPNPGSEGFTLLLNGPVLRRGSLLLYDAQGRSLGSYPIQQSSAQVDTRHLPAGLYLYRVVDMAGIPLVAGRWVKE